MKINFVKDYSHGCYSVYAVLLTSKGYKPLKLTIEVLPEQDESSYMEPSARIPFEFAKRDIFKAIVDGMVEAGLFPEVQGVVGELKATKYHLEDMRTLLLNNRDEREE